MLDFLELETVVSSHVGAGSSGRAARTLNPSNKSLHPPTNKFVKEKKIIFKRLQTILEDTYKRDFLLGGGS